MCWAINTKTKITSDEWHDFIKMFDENNDQFIDFKEFKNMIMGFT